MQTKAQAEPQPLARSTRLLSIGEPRQVKSDLKRRDADMTNGKSPYILQASSNLLGICFFIIAALRVTHLADRTWGDEISMAASLSFLAACLLSYASMRIKKDSLLIERASDYTFLTGLVLLFASIAAFYAGF
jgi:hypothetical protein